MLQPSVPAVSTLRLAGTVNDRKVTIQTIHVSLKLWIAHLPVIRKAARVHLSLFFFVMGEKLLKADECVGVQEADSSPRRV